MDCSDDQPPVVLTRTAAEIIAQYVFSAYLMGELMGGDPASDYVRGSAMTAIADLKEHGYSISHSSDVCSSCGTSAKRGALLDGLCVRCGGWE